MHVKNIRIMKFNCQIFKFYKKKKRIYEKFEKFLSKNFVHKYLTDGSRADVVNFFFLLVFFVVQRSIYLHTPRSIEVLNEERNSTNDLF